METITNAANAASKAVFGDSSSSQSGQEPVSGQTGRGTASEPYDAGNTTDNPRLAGLPGDDARPAFSSGRDRDELSVREGGTLGGPTYGSDNPYASSTGTTGGQGAYGSDRGGLDSNNAGPHTSSLANKLDPRIDSDGDGRGNSGPMDRESATMPGTSTTGSDYTSSTSGQLGATGHQPTMGSGYTSSTGGQSAGVLDTSTMGSDYTSSTTGQPGATGNQPMMGSGYTSSTGGQSATMPGTSTMGSGYTSSTSGQSAGMPDTSTMGSGYTSSTTGQSGATGNDPTMGSGYTSSRGGLSTTVPETSTMGSGYTSSVGQPGATKNLAINEIAEFITPSGGNVQVIDEGPAAGGIEGRFGPSHGVDLDGHRFPQDEGLSAPATGSGGASFNTTGSSTTAVNTSRSSEMTGSDNTSRDMGSQDNTSSNSGMKGLGDTSSGMTEQGGAKGSGIIGADVAGGSGGTSNRATGQDDTLSGPTGGMQQGANVQGGRPRPEHNTDKTGVTDMHSNDPKFSDVRQTEAGASSVDNSGHGISKGPTGGFGAAEPSVSSNPASGQKPTPKQQGADRPTEEPTGQQADAVKGEKEMTEKQQAGEDTSSSQSGQQPKKDPNDHSGEPLGTVDHSGEGEEKKHPGQAGGDPHGEDKSSKGTGEQWVKSTGMAADGGDFDATKPGAGKEAERLLEEKGIHHEPGMGKPAADTGAPEPSSKGGMGSTLKQKLHLG